MTEGGHLDVLIVSWLCWSRVAPRRHDQVVGTSFLIGSNCGGRRGAIGTYAMIVSSPRPSVPVQDREHFVGGKGGQIPLTIMEMAGRPPA